MEEIKNQSINQSTLVHRGFHAPHQSTLVHRGFHAPHQSTLVHRGANGTRSQWLCLLTSVAVETKQVVGMATWLLTIRSIMLTLFAARRC
jgi:hypothetical protein